MASFVRQLLHVFQISQRRHVVMATIHNLPYYITLCVLEDQRYYMHANAPTTYHNVALCLRVLCGVRRHSLQRVASNQL